MFVSPINIFCIRREAYKRDRVPFKSTSAGAPLKNLKNITDPYFGEKMITVTDYLKTEKIIDTKHTLKQTVPILKRFRNNMQIVEQNIYDTFTDASYDSPRKNFGDILRQLFAQAIIRLKLEELFVFDDIDNLSRNLVPETMFEVRKKTTKCRQIILDNAPDRTFKRKTVLTSLEQIDPRDETDEKVLADLKKCANYLPTSNTSINAFIVKYANRRHDEIAKRLIKASSQSIEHIRPDSMGGENVLSNFMLASSAANSLRGNMPLKDFIDMFPQVVSNAQLYINDIINVIHSGGLKGHQKYPYEVKKTLIEESEGLISLDLSKYNYTRKEAERLEEKYKNRWVGKFPQKN